MSTLLWKDVAFSDLSALLSIRPCSYVYIYSLPLAFAFSPSFVAVRVSQDVS